MAETQIIRDQRERQPADGATYVGKRHVDRELGRRHRCPTQVHEQGDDRYEDELARDAREQCQGDDEVPVLPEFAEQTRPDMTCRTGDEREHQEPLCSLSVDQWAESDANECRDKTQRAAELTVLRCRQADFVRREHREYRHRDAVADAVHELDGDEHQAHWERQDAKEVPEDADDTRVGYLLPRRGLARCPGQ